MLHYRYHNLDSWFSLSDNLNLVHNSNLLLIYSPAHFAVSFSGRVSQLNV